MRDLVLWILCGALGLTWGWGQQQRARERESRLQQTLASLGAPQGMSDSAERSLLLGEYAKGLSQAPVDSLYRQLAELFLLTAGDPKLAAAAVAVSSEGMARVNGTRWELFDRQGRPVVAELWRLGPPLQPRAGSLELGAGARVEAQGPWLISHDRQRWALFRPSGQGWLGYLSETKVQLSDGGRVLDARGRRWVWGERGLEAEEGSSDG